MGFLSCLFLFNFAIWPILGIGASMKASESNLVAEITAIPSTLDVSLVNTAGDYIVLNHLNRNLVKLNKFAKIEGELIDRWTVEDDFKKYILHVAPNSRFSDGSPISGVDVLESIQRQMRLNTANHFNFGGIKEIKLIDQDTLQVNLKHRNPLFIRHLTYPEFGVLHKSQRDSKVGLATYTITSGPYTLESLQNGRAQLIKNPYFPFSVQTPPNKITLQSGDPATLIERLKKSAVDISMMLSTGTKSDFQQIESSPNLSIFRPHMGYTFWVSINPLSKKLRSLPLRNHIQTLLKSDGFNFADQASVWAPANQLYLPDGLGRPSEARLNEVWRRIKLSAKAPIKRKKLRILLGNHFPFNDEIIAKLSVDFELEIVTNTTPESRQKLIASRTLDLFVINNDYSSEDLHENLQTTFNKRFPLVTTESKLDQCQTILRDALNSDDESQRHKIYEKIGMMILEKGYIAPIAYRKTVFVHNARLDLSNFSTLYSNFNLWNISLKKQ